MKGNNIKINKYKLNNVSVISDGKKNNFNLL